MSVLVKTVHAAIVEGKDLKLEIQRRVINYRNTPHPSTGKAPNQLIMGRLLNTKIPSTTSLSSNRRLPSRHLLTLSPTRFTRVKGTQITASQGDRLKLRNKEKEKCKLLKE